MKKKLWSLQNLHAELRNKDNGKSPEIALFVKKASDDIQILLDSIDRPNEEIFPPNFILVRKIFKTTKHIRTSITEVARNQRKPHLKLKKDLKQNLKSITKTFQLLNRYNLIKYQRMLLTEVARKFICQNRISPNILKQNRSIIIVVAVLQFLVVPNTLSWNQVMVF